MEINSNLSICKPSHRVAFGMTKKLPFVDVMSIMTSTFVSGTEKSVEKTVAKIINRPFRKDVAERYLDNLEARSILMQRCPDLIPKARDFKKLLDNVSYNQYAITTEDAAMIADKAVCEYGSKFVNVEI